MMTEMEATKAWMKPRFPWLAASWAMTGPTARTVGTFWGRRAPVKEGCLRGDSRSKVIGSVFATSRRMRNVSSAVDPEPLGDLKSTEMKIVVTSLLITDCYFYTCTLTRVIEMSLCMSNDKNIWPYSKTVNCQSICKIEKRATVALQRVSSSEVVIKSNSQVLLFSLAFY